MFFYYKLQPKKCKLCPFIVPSGIDLFDKTPILDIKPFLPSIDYVVSEKNMTAEIYLGHHDEDFITDSLVKEFVLGKKDNDKINRKLNKKHNVFGIEY